MDKNDGFYQEKYFVAKINDLSNLLKKIGEQGKSQEQKYIVNFLNNLAKLNLNDYLVINTDESYADEVYNIIKNNEQKQIIAFVGRAGSGKDYQCNLLENQGFTKMAFADALRYIAFKCFDLDYDEGIELYDELKAEECITFKLGYDIQNKFNFRQFLEKLGTQGIRYYDNDFWVRCLIHDIERNNYKKVCISDLRFTNEYKLMKQFAEENGYIFKCIFCNYKSDRYQETNNHESARFSNFLVEQGYKDLQEVDEDICNEFEKQNIRK